MVFGVVMAALCAPAGYLAGFNLAARKGMENPQLIGFICTFPPIGCFAAVMTIMEEHV